MINAIIISSILVVSLSIFLWGIWKRKNTGIALAGALLLFGLFVLLDKFPEYANTFNAWAMLLLALAAFLAVSVTIELERRRVKHSDEQENRRREEEQEKEKRDRKEQLLNEIIKWAEDISNASITPDFSARGKAREVNILYRYALCLTKATSIETIVGEKFQKELLVDFTNILGNLFRFVCIAQLMFLHTLPTEEVFPKDVIDEIKNEIKKKPIGDLFAKYATDLNDSVNKLLRKANKIKIELL